MSGETREFVHLHVHTEYSLLDGASRIPDLIAETKRLGMKAIAITDHGNMYGVVNFYKEAKKAGIKPVIGCEVYLAPGARQDRTEVNGVRYYHLILLVENETGYKNLGKLISQANIDGMYYKPRVDKELLRKYHEGLICLSACIAGEIPQALLADNMKRAEELTEEYIDIFGQDNFFIEIQDHGMKEERKALSGLVRLAEKYGLGLVATNDLHYVRRGDAGFHDVLLCIQTNRMVDDPDRMRFPSDDFYLKSPAEMALLFSDYPEAIKNSVRIAERCNFDFVFGKRFLPNFPLPEGLTDEMYLRQLCEENLTARYPEPTEEVRSRLDYELGIIHQMGFDSYFLIVWDFINHSRSEGIAVGPGRGSAAGSIVAYILGITDIDPLHYKLLFERFLNPERVTMPDIDVDFCYQRRGEVIEYVKRRYGNDHVAQIITFGTMAAKGAVRDVGRALNMTYADVDSIAKLIPNELGITLDKAIESAADFRKVYEENPAAKKLIDIARQVEGLPRHSSTHAAGVVIAREALTEYMPVQVSDDGTYITQYDKDLVEELGLLKMDFLGLRTLTVIADTLKNIKDSSGREIDISHCPLDDKKTAEMLCAGDTSAVFQMESAGMTKLVVDLHPSCFADLIPTVALYRPGPLGSGMVNDFIDGRHGKKKVTYMHPLLEPILRETFGVVLYQEQVMQIVQALAGFSLGQADILRRAMGKKKHELLMKQKEGFLKGTKENGIPDELANKIFELLTHFADYGFNKSHSAAYALVAWQTAYLKAHYPAEFMAAMLSSVKDYNEKVSEYIEKCRQMKIDVLPPDVNASRLLFTVDKGAVRFGLAAIKNLGEAAVASIEKARLEDGPFVSLMDFCMRVDGKAANKRVIESLIKCGAFDSLGAKRSQLLAVAEQCAASAAVKLRDIASGQIGLFGEEELNEAEEIKLPDIPEVPDSDITGWEKELTGFYITGHPLKRYLNILENFPRFEDMADGNVPDNRLVRVGGLVTEAKRFTTKKGDTMCFLTIEDYYMHKLEVVVFPRIFYEHVNLFAVDVALVVQGKTNRTADGTKVLADIVWPLDGYKPDCYIAIKSVLATDSNMSRLVSILADHHGDRAVYLHFVDSKRVQALDEALWIDGSPEVIASVEELFGKGCIKQR